MGIYKQTINQLEEYRFRTSTEMKKKETEISELKYKLSLVIET